MATETTTALAVSVPAGYVSKSEALRVLEKKSDSSLESYVQRGLIESTLVPRPGRKSERVYLLDSLAALKKNGRLNKQADPENPQKPRLPSRLELALPDGLLASLARPRRPKLWLTLKEARDYSGLSKRKLYELIQEEKLVALKDRGWKIRAKSLEEFAG